MGWFHDKYGKDAHPIMPIDDYSKVYDACGEEAANQALVDIQEGRMSVETFEKYWRDDWGSDD